MTRRNVSLAKFFNTGISGTTLSENAVTGVDSDYVTNTLGQAVASYDSLGSLPLTGDAGAYAYLTGTDNLVIGTGEGWLELKQINRTPVITTSLESEYTLSKQDSLQLSILATDSDGIPLSYSYSLDPLVDSGILYVQQDSSNFSIFSGDSFGDTTITFTVSDGVNTASTSTDLAVSNVSGTYTQTTVGSDTVYKFTGDGTITIPVSSTAWVLVVGGGGGGGGSYYSAGGGAGAFLEDTSLSMAPGTYTVTVGAGQQGGGFDEDNPLDGTASGYGGTSSIIGGSIDLQAAGGARGGGFGSAGGDGILAKAGDARSGSSGGGGAPGGSAAGGSGAGNGNDGGAGDGPPTNAGGGGGAGGNGVTPTTADHVSDNTSNGGAGLSSTITGSSEFYAAGGGGFYFNGQTYYGTRASGIGGKSSGGGVSLTADLTELSGLPNTGAGGAGAEPRQPSYTRAGDGGSGVVIIRILGS